MFKMAEVHREIDIKANEVDLEQYWILSKRLKEIENEKNVLNKVIKSYFDNKPGVYQIGNYVANIYEQDRSKMDEEKLVKLLKSKGLHDCLKLVISFEEDKVEEALYKGQLTPEELSECIVPNKVLSLLVKKGSK